MSNIIEGSIPSSMECRQFVQQNVGVFANTGVQRIKTWVGHQHKLLFKTRKCNIFFCLISKMYWKWGEQKIYN